MASGWPGLTLAPGETISLTTRPGIRVVICATAFASGSIVAVAEILPTALVRRAATHRIWWAASDAASMVSAGCCDSGSRAALAARAQLPHQTTIRAETKICRIARP